MEMALYIAGGLVLLVAGGETLVRNATGAAARLGVPPFVIGASVVAFGTSVPELVVSVRASLGGHAGFVVGNVVGSNIANVLLALGAAALVRPLAVSDTRPMRVDAAVMLAVTAAFAVFALTLPELDRIGGALFVALLALVTVRTVRRGELPAAEVPEPSGTRRLGFTVPLIVVGLAVVAVGAELLVEGASDAARALGVSEVVIGLSVVAVGTSLPEMAVTAAAVRRGQAGLALGNILGSNLFNILGITGAAALAHPLALASLGSSDSLRLEDLALMLATAAGLAAVVMLRVRIPRAAGAAMIALYLAYLALLYHSPW